MRRGTEGYKAVLGFGFFLCFDGIRLSQAHASEAVARYHPVKVNTSNANNTVRCGGQMIETNKPSAV
jgi:hypothetical protein